MLDSHNTFLTPTFLRSVWNTEYEAFKGSEAEHRLIERLRAWAARADLKETSAEAAFIRVFFEDTWGYVQSGQAGAAGSFTLWPKFTISGAGAQGGAGEADLALGYFGSGTPTPQVVCEFKSIKTALDAEQRRKGNTRSPVRQCLDYLSHARKGMIGSEPMVPTWGLVSDMNEFRIYWYDRGYQQYVRFVIEPRDLFQGAGLLADTEAARFDRFLFIKLFHRDTLLTSGGPPLLLRLIQQRRFRDREIEDTFYTEYRAFRDHLYTELLTHNGPGTPRFPGTRGRLVRLAQKILDRLLFVFFCEDMGQTLAFPPKMMQDFLVSRADDPYFDLEATTIWQDLLRLFSAMNEGTAFGGKAIHQFNGGLFVPDGVLEALRVPNGVFCQHQQGQDEASIAAHKLTALYLCATYNYAADLGEGGTRHERRSLGLYTLGRIFEQSITELEIREAEADDRPSINKLSRRKTDGVYYTPEWVVERVVDGTLGPVLARLKREHGWPSDDNELPTVEAIDSYLARLQTFTVLDPACGSGAFLITALRYLAVEWKRVRAMRAQIAGASEDTKADDAALVRDLLRTNIYGVDINPASVEIAQLALWLHTARGDQPLSLLDRTMRCGNSLVTEDFYRGVQLTLDEAEKERINAFNWREQFPEVAARGGFDAVVGNPPYVRLQILKAAQRDVADYLIEGRPAVGFRPFQSTQEHNPDLYVPFIERGLAMLNDGGRLGYIAPSVWTVNDYGARLRTLVSSGRHLDRWLDFKSFQVFDESTTYTAIQLFSKSPTEKIRVAVAPTGLVSPDPWEDANSALVWGGEQFADRWLLLTGSERALIDRLTATCTPLNDPAHTTDIFVGVQTSADAVYYLKRLGPGRYLCRPPGRPRPDPYEVAIEDKIMRPLVSGADVKRYVEPVTDMRVLFPYKVSKGRPILIPPETMAARYPKAWAYLREWRHVLERREAIVQSDGSVSGPVYDDEWYRYVYPKNLDKQHLPKLVLPRLVAHLACALDAAGAVCLDNVDVGGALVSEGENPWFLAGVLNSPVADFVFRRISRPFRGDYLSANKQFIAPIPIPTATPDQRITVANSAAELQRLHTSRRDTLSKISRRLEGAPVDRRSWEWLLHGLPSHEVLYARAPTDLDRPTRRRWAREQQAKLLKARLDEITPRLRPGVALDAVLVDGELSFLVNGVPVVDRVFVEESEGLFLLAQWKVLASTITVPDSAEGKWLCERLRSFSKPGGIVAAEQVVQLAQELGEQEAKIREEEGKANKLTFELYGLSEAERELIARSL